MSIKAIILDLDGVIVTTDEQHYRAWKLLADRLKIPFTREDNNRFRGVSRMACMDIMEELSGRSFTPAEKLEFAAWKNDRYCELLENMSTSDLSVEVKKTLETLRQRGYLLAIGSSSRNTKFILDRIGLGSFFDAISDGNNITQSKPDPEVFLKAADTLRIPAGECAVIEDAVSGVQAARAACMFSVAIGEAVTAHIADKEISAFAELLELFP